MHAKTAFWPHEPKSLAGLVRFPRPQSLMGVQLQTSQLDH